MQDNSKNRKITTKPISWKKELFLAICLMSEEISPETVREMKKDFGVSNISGTIIHELSDRKIIEKVGYRSQYGFKLTEYGLDYLMHKAPEKYDYEFFGPKCLKKKYDKKSRERSHALSMILYQLVKSGVDITYHHGEAYRVFNGYEVEIDEPFFVTAKEIRDMNLRFSGKLPTMSYGCIITQNNIIAVYYPDPSHHLRSHNETAWHGLLLDSTKFPNAHFKDTRCIEALYFFTDVAGMKDSYAAGAQRAGRRSASTRRCYKDLKYFQSHTLLLNSPTSRLEDIICNERRNKIDEAFMYAFGVEPCAPTIEAIFADGIFENDEYGRMFTALLWDLNPQKITQIMENIREKSRQVLVLCFEEQMPIIQEVFSVNKRIANKVRYGCLPYAEVMAAVEYDPQAEALVG